MQSSSGRAQLDHNPPEEILSIGTSFMIGGRHEPRMSG